MRNCNSCKFWEQWSDGDDAKKEGFCHRYAPRAQMFLEDFGLEGDQNERLIWPSTHSDNWCGDWVRSYRGKAAE